MAPPQGFAAYKKQNGIIAISKDRKSVSWIPSSPPDASPSLVISATTITNLQQTPESSAKVMLKVFVKEGSDAEPVAHVFNFTSASDARGDANNIKEALTNSIQAAKAAENAAAIGNSGSSAAMAIANALSGPKTWEDDDRLKDNTTLQQSLMQADPSLRKTFMEALKTKPESISATQFTSQFWSSRVHLLRAHIIAKGQDRGSYNVLSALKKEEGGKKMNLSPEHVRLIFAQYPLMRRVYDEVVPEKLKELVFWSRFFQSRLYLRLRGEKIDEDRDPEDRILDAYVEAEELTGIRSRTENLHIPRIIDMEGNEENHSQRKGNKPDREQRPKSHKDVPIIRALNDLSEKLMSKVAASDVDPSQPIGMDEATYENLRLRDLQGDPEQYRIILKIRDQSQFMSEGRDSNVASVIKPAARIDPAAAIERICTDMAEHFPRPGAGILKVGFGQQKDGDSDEGDDESLQASAKASAHIIELVRQNRAQTEETSAYTGLSELIIDRLKLTHATSNEFLHQFWSAFLSGDPERAGEVNSLAESLNRSDDRIKAVAKDAEDERNHIIRKTKKNAAEIFEKTGKRQNVNYKAIGGGAEVVNRLLGPTTKALSNAIVRYQKALREQRTGEDG